MKAIIDLVAKEFAVTPDQIMGRQRWQPLAMARQVAHVLSLEAQPYADPGHIARQFNRERTLLIHSRKAVANAEATDPRFKAKVGTLRIKLKKVLARKPSRA